MTPMIKCQELASFIGAKGGSSPQSIYIKREDLNPSGSHKDRALIPFVDTLVKEGEREFCLSSSGNLAIAAALYAQIHKSVKFHLFVPKTLSKEKRERLFSYCDPRLDRGSRNKNKQEIDFSFGFLDSRLHGNDSGVEKVGNVLVRWSKAPKRDAIKFARQQSIRLLRGSTDEGMLEGYHDLARELVEQADGKIGSIFMAVSSGTSLLGLWQGLKTHNPHNPPYLKGEGRGLPQLHIIQTTKVHPIAEEFDRDFTPAKTSIATAIVDRVAHRKDQVVKVVKESGGWGWVASDEEITEAQRQLRQAVGEDVSAESAMSLAGLKKALARGFEVREPVVPVFTGK